MSTPTSRGTAIIASAKETVSKTRDRRYTWWQFAALIVSLLLVVVAVSRIPGNDWGLRLRHGWYHLFVVAWFCLLSYRWRTVGAREIVRFWIMGFFPVALVAYLLTEPLEWLIGTGNLQTGIWVPIVEELVKVAPLVLWATLLKPRHRHATLTDFWILGFAIGAGFSFHEDALYDRLVASGFHFGPMGTFFPMMLSGSAHMITHAGLTAIAGFGVGLVAIYRTRVWSYLLGAALVGFAILDHAALNWSGIGYAILRLLVAQGHTGDVLLTVAVVSAVVHDWLALRWASRRDKLFPDPKVRDDFVALGTGAVADRIGTLAARQRYRRFRNAAFADLYRVRSTGQPAGDRRRTISQLRHLEASARLPATLT